MNNKNKLVMIFSMALAFLSLPAKAKPIIEHQDIQVTVDAKMQHVQVSTHMRFKGLIKEPIEFLLNKSARDLNVKQGNKDITFNFDQSKFANPFIEGYLLTLNQGKTGIAEATFRYTLPIAGISYWNAKNLPPEYSSLNGFETGLYSAWLPTELGLSDGGFSYKVTVNAPQGYQILGNGKVTQESDNKWLVSSTALQFDVPLIVSNKLEKRTFKSGAGTVEINHFGKSKQEINKLVVDIGDILSLFTQQYGELQQSGSVQFVFVPRSDGASFSRKGFAAITRSGSELGKYATIAHEVGHFWWSGADVSSWEDWLNESFAEHASLTAINKKFGQDIFNKRIQLFAKQTKKARAIVGLDRNHDSATMILYRKGPALLEKLRAKMGDESYFAFLTELVVLDVKTTSGLLEQLKAKVSSADHLWFAEALKS